jgi:hypothetical protein
MSLELIIAATVSVITVVLYVVALWIGDDHTVSMLAGASNFTIAVFVIMTALALSLGVSASLLLNPNCWLHAVGNLI